MRSPLVTHSIAHGAVTFIARRHRLRLLAVGAVALLMAAFTGPAGVAHADRGLTSGAVAQDSCAEDDYDCWYNFFKDLMDDSGDDGDGASRDDARRDLSLCVLGIDFAGTGCVEDHVGGAKPTQPSRTFTPMHVLGVR